MRERGLRAIAGLCEQADDKANAVLLDSYKKEKEDSKYLTQKTDCCKSAFSYRLGR